MKKFFSIFLLSMFFLSSITAEASVLTIFDYINATETKVDETKNTEKDKDKVSVEKHTSKATSATNKENKKNDIEVFNQKGSSLKITKADIDLMAKLVYCESRGEPFEGKIAVASVVLNRVMNPKFPNTINDVIFQKNAFSCVQNGKIVAQPNKSCYDAVYEAIRGKDPTNEALFFYNPEIATCSWMKSTSKKDSKTIGNHTFFKQ
ncbi:MAG: cell wall hydrolase [Clostridium sp.]|uniref:cell wall hydrolase n=1 Tax=Clostridium sp. TaxID=1506 RepID=UPI003F344F19